MAIENRGRFFRRSRIALALVLASIVSYSSGCRGGREEGTQTSIPSIERRTNVLIVTLDTTRRDRIGAYAPDRDLTPNIDRIASEGIVFLDARTEIPITLPVHCSMMTGLGVLDHGVRENGTFVLDDAALTLAEVLEANKYQTAAFVSTFVLDSRFGIAQGFEHFDDDLSASEGDSLEWQGHDVEHWERPAEMTTDSAIEWVQAHVDPQADDPFFMWVHYYDPHEPWDPPEPHKSRHAPYDGEIAHMDEQFGRLIEELEESGLLDSTLVVIASDHGENIGEHGSTGHGFDLYEHAMRTVFIMRLPGTIPAGSRHASRLLPSHIAPTVVDLLGIHDSGLVGQSLQPLWTGEGEFASPDPLYMETLLPALRRDRSAVVGVLDGDIKLVVRPKLNQFELFDINQDPGEFENLAAKRPAKLEELKQKLAEISDEAGKESHARPVELDEVTAEMLEALGYGSSGDSGD